MPPAAEGFATRLVLGPALRTQPDWRLVTLVRGGYETAFEEIVRRYGKSLTRYAAAIVGNRGEDVVQDSFSKALLALRRDGAEIELRPWLFRIVRNTALNDLRARPPSAEALAVAIAGGQNPAEAAERREELADLMRRLGSLPEPQRAAIVMRELEGLSHEEIAAALGLSGGAARQAIYRARRALRDAAGLLLPLPLLEMLLGGAVGGAEVAASAAGASGAGVGAGAALKAATATVLVAGAVGTGVAIQEARHERGGDGRTQGAAAQPSSLQAPANTEASGGEAESTEPGGHGHTEDSSGPGPGNRDEDGGHDRDRGGGSGPSADGDRDRADEDRSGKRESDDDSGDHSGPSSAGSGSSRSGSSSGPGGELGGEEADSSGPGGGSSSSGSGPGEEGSDSSGSGSDDVIEELPED